MKFVKKSWKLAAHFSLDSVQASFSREKSKVNRDTLPTGRLKSLLNARISLEQTERLTSLKLYTMHNFDWIARVQIGLNP